MDERELQAERLRLKAVTAVIRKQLDEWEQTERKRKSDMNELAKHLWEEVTIDPQASAESAVSLSQQTQVWAELYRSYGHASEMRQALEAALPSPYFARIDFREEGQSAAEPVYIGKRSIVDEASGRYLTLDWRAPLAGVYYDYGLGEARYETPEGEVRGYVDLKRQYRIRNGELEFAIDTGLQIGDTILQEMLSRNAGERMRSIVTTIQREQNAVIRDDHSPVLIVQGAAGSGKTSIALQRVAYLLYKYRKRIQAEHIVLFSPNLLFADYVSGVLPELGESNMRQMTFHDYAAGRIGKQLHVEDRYALMEKLLAETDETERARREACIRFKTSADYMRVILRYIGHLEREGAIFRDVIYRTKPIVTAETLRDWFYGRYAAEPAHVRLDKMKEKIVDAVKAYAVRQTKRVFRQLQNDPRYLGTDKELMNWAKRRVGERIDEILEEVGAFGFVDIPAMYRQLLEDEALFRRMAEAAGAAVPPDWTSMKTYALEWLSRSTVPYEDATALLYMKESLEGLQTFNPVRHVLVDEAQDYDVFQLYVLRKLFPRARFTLLGDLNQSILAEAGLTGYGPVEDVFGREHCRTFRLTRSYRSTMEISAFTTSLLPEGEPVEPVTRSGRRPALVIASDAGRMTQLAARDAAALLADGLQSVAVICRTQADAYRAHAALRAEGAAARLLTRDDARLGSGLLVLPSYLAKGLEFDAVLVWDASAGTYVRESERRLFYTVCTRALHTLRLYAVGEPSRFVAEADPELYDVES